jgi:hypothetical protein
VVASNALIAPGKVLVVATGALRDYCARPLEGKAPGPAQPFATLQSQCQWRPPSDEREWAKVPTAGGGQFQVVQTETAVA